MPGAASGWAWPRMGCRTRLLGCTAWPSGCVAPPSSARCPSASLPSCGVHRYLRKNLKPSSSPSWIRARFKRSPVSEKHPRTTCVPASPFSVLPCGVPRLLIQHCACCRCVLTKVALCCLCSASDAAGEKEERDRTKAPREAAAAAKAAGVAWDAAETAAHDARHVVT